MDFPQIVDPIVDAVDSGSESAPTLAGVVQGDADTMDMWQYFVERIDEFAVAKSIVDHFDANPKDLVNSKIGVDVYALFLRAKVTIKREQIAFAAAQTAVTRAREQSRSFRGMARAVSRHVKELRQAILAQPQIVAIAVAFMAYYLAR